MTALSRFTSVVRLDVRTVVGVLLAGLTAALILYTTRPEPTMSILVADRDLDAGAPLAELPLATRRVRTAEGAVLEESRSDLAGWSLAAPLRAGEPLLPSLLRAPEQRRNPHLLAMAVEEEHGVLGRIAAGDLVDVYATRTGPVDSAAVTERIARELYVVAVEESMTGLAGGARLEMLVAVDEDLALRLVGALRTAELDFVRVSP